MKLMNLENKSVFTTLGWNGKKSFFALNEHFERLESQAKILGLSFDENIKMKIIKQLKIKDLKFDNYNYSNELYKPPGLVTIKLMENNKFLITARSNEYNIKCKFIDAITVNGNSVYSSSNAFISGLMPGETYDVYVQADCGSDGLTSWAGPLSFSPCPAFIAPSKS